MKFLFYKNTNKVHTYDDDSYIDYLYYYDCGEELARFVISDLSTHSGVFNHYVMALDDII